VDNGNNAGLTRLKSGLWPAGLVFGLTISGAAIVKPDMKATNGVAQGIDAVMLPTFAPPKNL